MAMGFEDKRGPLRLDRNPAQGKTAMLPPCRGRAARMCGRTGQRRSEAPTLPASSLPGVRMTAPLFSPFELGPVRLSNRIVVAPMCQYSANAGRKASAQRPWEGGRALKEGDDPWTTYAPSPLPFDEGWPIPEELADADLARIEKAFVQAAQRAVRIGFEGVELHMAHGYLLHTFQSPLSNRRGDRWAGSAEKRMAFPLSVARAVRAAVPGDVALGARITGSDWTEDGLKPEDAVTLSRALKEIGLDFVCVSSGGIALKAKIPVGPGYQVPFAAKVRREAGIATRAVGMILEPAQANDIVTRGDADLVALARAMLDDPRWGWHAAEALGVEIPRPPQYARVAPALWPGAALVRPREDDEFRRSA